MNQHLISEHRIFAVNVCFYSEPVNELYELVAMDGKATNPFVHKITYYNLYMNTLNTTGHTPVCTGIHTSSKENHTGISVETRLASNERNVQMNKLYSNLYSNYLRHAYRNIHNSVYTQIYIYIYIYIYSAIDTTITRQRIRHYT